MNFQNFKFSLYSILLKFDSPQLLALICFVFSLALFISATDQLRDKLKIALLLLSTSASAFFGARIMHVALEAPYLLKSPEKVFTQFDGMTFNGSLFFGFLVLLFGFRMFPDHLKKIYWNKTAIVASFSYGLLRIGCFATGCCWGKISAVPWSIKYSNSHVMPWLGIPVHPVQLYDAMIGLLLFFLLYILDKKSSNKISLFPLFITIYSLGRFVTEFFRGDGIRGDQVILNLSTSQVVSVILLLATATWYFVRHVRIRLSRSAVLLIVASFFVAGCLPEPPNEQDFKLAKKTDSVEIFQTKKASTSQKKNVLFVVADDNIQARFSKILKSSFNLSTPPTLEDLAFWDYNKNLKNVYNVIVRIKPGQVSYKTFSKSLHYLESLHEPYDLIILTHGFPNHLSTGSGYFFSYKELAILNNKLTYLNLVMLQSCYGKSLADDFKRAGAKYVMSYPGLNQNFLFYGIFLKYYYPGISVEAAYKLAVDNYDFHIRGILYSKITDFILAQHNHILEQVKGHRIAKDAYIAQLLHPDLE